MSKKPENKRADVPTSKVADTMIGMATDKPQNPVGRLIPLDDPNELMWDMPADRDDGEGYVPEPPAPASNRPMRYGEEAPVPVPAPSMNVIYGNVPLASPSQYMAKPGSKRKSSDSYRSSGISINSSQVSRHYVPKMTESSGGEFSNEDLDSVKSAIKINKVEGVTTVVGLVVDVENDGNNHIVAIRCSGGQPFTGFIYDHAQDSYLVRGITFLDLGRFDFALRVSLPGVEEWSQNVPIPNEILEKYFSAAQRKIIEEHQKSYPSPKYKIKFIQMVA